MLNKKVIFLLFLIFLSVSAVNAAADDVNSTDADNKIVLSESDSGNFTELSGLIKDNQNGTLNKRL